jgi:predicted outer membrane repeat protein
MKTLILIFVLLVASTFLYSTIINVPGDQPTIQEGINVAVDTDTVLVQPDTYIENIDYIGKNITVASLFLTTQDTIYISQTIIDGDSIDSVVIFENAEDSTAVLIGFTITNGYSDAGGGISCDGSSPNLVSLNVSDNIASDGGGISCINHSNPSVINLILRRNLAAEGGGICLDDSSNVSLTNVTMSENEAGWWGGGINCEDSSVISLMDVIVSTNTAQYGGGIFCKEESNLSLVNVTITGNSVDYYGGGIYSEDNSNLNLENVTVSQNIAGNEGGGIYSSYSDLQIENCDFIGNTAQGDYGGGAINYHNYGDPSYAGILYQVVITNSYFSNNTASNTAGGVYIGQATADLSLINVMIECCEFVDNVANGYSGISFQGSMLTFSVLNSIFSGNEAISYAAGGGFSGNCTGEMINCLFASNTAATGGGYWNSGGISVWTGTNVDLVNCTFVDNSAAYGAGLTVGSGGTATITDCVFWGNSYNQIALVDYNDQGGTLFVDYCDVQDGIDSVSVSPLSTLNWGIGNINEDPLFIGTGDYPFSLQDLSPCVNAGIPDTTGLNLPEFDLAGNPRVFGGRIDMGAYENQNVVGANEDLIPLITKLNQNYPNPFNPSTTINYSLKENSKVTLNIYNIKGQKVKQLVSHQRSAGQHSVVWNGTDDSGKSVSSGIYFYKLKAGDFQKVRKMILIK